ncbi:LysR substrate-binding domain-containing protein [Ectothiorhodospira lacustris]|uniref:LysR substrate-binding domain-containing protein n=1 Tax=Ectothiorhodospira lacustris TaxID=2899127 RepID=UPI001EE8DD5A|nr:LysR substrate-binding domain-containing protein [Ectothiorhodospira lacustris]MCG5500226.1 LysR substrate-binding domain-containing protein [Ectothiorhodospira lacustris]MCG5509550.1 LysR substrate-binding domain-containing protein [Ectothiorhodospira lacustris]MCG5521655.1 LysR substrate-binding domain-containing protein [Ectothiorhodospira lacustris]
MKLQQLRYLQAIARYNLNISEAADRLATSQPGISKQIRLLEEELGVPLFQRNGKHLSGMTAVGRRVLEYSEVILREVENIRAAAEEARDEQAGDLRIATTHAQARYILPPIVDAFRHRFPRVRVQIHQGTPRQIADMLSHDEVDFIVATEPMLASGQVIVLPAYRWSHCVVVPKGHELAGADAIPLERLADYPIVTYLDGFSGRTKLDADFRRAGLTPDVVLTAADADVIKTYVRHGMGVGIIARIALEKGHDDDLVALDTEPGLSENITRIGFRRGAWLRGYMYDFITLLAPHLTHEHVARAAQNPDPENLEALCRNMKVPEGISHCA